MFRRVIPTGPGQLTGGRIGVMASFSSFLKVVPALDHPAVRRYWPSWRVLAGGHRWVSVTVLCPICCNTPLRACKLPAGVRTVSFRQLTSPATDYNGPIRQDAGHSGTQ